MLITLLLFCFYSSASTCAGMMLEMDPAALHQLLSDHTMLQVAVQKAQAALDTRNQTPEEHSNILRTEWDINNRMTPMSSDNSTLGRAGMCL